MAKSDRPGPSEFGGKGGILQRAEDGHSSYADTAADVNGVREAAMVMRKAGKGEVLTKVEETWVPGEGIEIIKTPYSEEQARKDLEEEH